MDSPTPTSSALPQCTTAIPDSNGFVPPDSCNAHYGFYPSWEWNLTFALAFGLTTIVHLVQMFIFKKWFCWVVIMGSLWECGCFVLRTLGARDQQNSTYVLVSTLLFLLAPLWINAFAYMIVARLVHFLLPRETILNISPRWLAKIFVVADVVSFFVQAAGGGMIAGEDGGDTVKNGQRVYMAGIGIQLFFVIVFVVVSLAFTLRLQRKMRAGLLQRDPAWVQPLVWTIFAVLILIVIRIIFRFVEFSGDISSSNPILSNEAYQLGLDALPMFVALLMLNIVHPGVVLKGPESSFPKGWRRRQVDKSGTSSSFEPLNSSSFEMGTRST